jgi:hypothetical protein
MPFDLSRALPYFSPVYSAEDTAPIQAVGNNDAPIIRIFSTTLNIHYMVDEPGALVFVRERDVERQQRDALHEQALANLRGYTARRKLRFEMKASLHAVRLDGQHDASLLLLDELWDPPTRVADVSGELVAAIPARNVLLFTGSLVPNGLRDLRAAILRTSDRALSPELFVRRDGGWDSFDS